jgi:hypothetical protein
VSVGGDYSVLIIDLFHHDPEEDYVIGGLPTYGPAWELARRRVRGSVGERDWQAIKRIAGDR